MATQQNFNAKAEEAKLRQLVEDILKQAKNKGATATAVGAAADAGFSVNVRMGEVDTIEYQQDKSFGITVYFGQRKGSASTSDTSQKAIEQTLQAACDIAKYTSEDPYSGLADKALMAVEFPDVDSYHPWDISTEQAIERAKQCEAKGMASDRRIKNSEGVALSTIAASHVYGNSHGFIGVTSSTRHTMSCVLVAEQGDEKQRDYEFSTVRDAVDMLPIDSIASTAAKKTVQRLGSKPISTRTTPVIFSANLAKSVIGSLVAAVSGGNLYRQSSFLLDSLGTQVLPNWLNLTEKPHIKKALGSSAFDAEGVATKEQALVKQGILEHYVLGSYSARKLGLQTTANAGGVHNLIVDHSGLGFEELVKEMDTGFLVTELIGQGVNIVTGDYSRGAAGFWIEKGEIVQSVEEVTIAGNLKDMLLGIEKIADDVDMRGNIRCGSMLINQMQLAGK